MIYFQDKGSMTSLTHPFREFKYTSLQDHHPTTQRKTNAATASLGGKEGYEKRLTVFGWDGQSIVTYIQTNHFSFLCFHHHLLSVSLYRIFCQIHQYLS
jgi:hypothetical protein